MRPWTLAPALALALAACQADKKPPRERPARDAGFAITGTGAGARPLLGARPGPDAAVGLPGVPWCNRLLLIYDVCAPTFPIEARKAMKDASLQMRDAWKSALDSNPDIAEMIDGACKQAVEGTESSFVAAGCKLP